MYKKTELQTSIKDTSGFSRECPLKITLSNSSLRITVGDNDNNSVEIISSGGVPKIYLYQSDNVDEEPQIIELESWANENH